MRSRTILTLVVAASPAVLAAATTEAGPPPRPNVVLIVSDDQGYGDVSCFGGDLPTPHVDSIARRGARLTSWYVAAPVCTPSRYALMTGRYPQRSQGGLDRVLMMFDEKDATKGLREGETTIAARLRAGGYRTALIGKWHLGHGGAVHFPTRHGFDEFYGATGGCTDYFTHRYADVADWYRDEQPVEAPGYGTDLLTDRAIAFIGRQTRTRPFFLCLAYLAPHYGKSCEEEILGASHTLVTRKVGWPRVDAARGRSCQPLDTLQAKLSDLEALAHLPDAKRRYYAAMVKAMDDGIGRVLDALREAGLDDDTIVIFMADNGPDETVSSAGSSGPLRGAKHALWEGGVRVPCVMQWPARLPPGTTIDQVGGAIDLFPTLCRLAGVETGAAALDGIDLVPAWLEGRVIERDLYWRHGGTTALRRGDWKLVGDALFDLVADPAETTDLAGVELEKLQELIEVRRAIEDRLAGEW